MDILEELVERAEDRGADESDVKMAEVPADPSNVTRSFPIVTSSLSCPQDWKTKPTNYHYMLVAMKNGLVEEAELVEFMKLVPGTSINGPSYVHKSNRYYYNTNSILRMYEQGDQYLQDFLEAEPHFEGFAIPYVNMVKTYRTSSGVSSSSFVTHPISEEIMTDDLHKECSMEGILEYMETQVDLLRVQKEELQKAEQSARRKYEIMNEALTYIKDKLQCC